MSLYLRTLIRRLRHTGLPVLLRLTGLTLAAVLAAAVPAFVPAAMEQVLHRELAAAATPTGLVVNWTAADTGDQTAAIAELDRYLRETFPAAAGLNSPGGHSGAETAQLLSLGRRPVQQVEADGRLRATKRYLHFGPLPPGLTLVSGRLPAPDLPEVVLTEPLAAKAGYQPGDRLRVPLTAVAGGEALTVTVVGTVGLPDTGALAHLKEALENAVFTAVPFWDGLGRPAAEAVWGVDLPAAALHAAGLDRLVPTLQELPLRVARLLPDADLISSPLAWLADFQRQMTATVRLLQVLLLPVFLLITAFVVTTAGAVVTSRQVEITVLRSRGATPLRVVGFYLGESALLAGAAALLGLGLTVPTVRLMWLCAGFLQLVGRPPLPVTLGTETALSALLAAALAEAACLLPLVGAVRSTVATRHLEAAARGPVARLLRSMLELGLLAVLAYGTWRLRSGADPGDPLFLSLPALALTAGGLVAWRLLELALSWLGRLCSRRLTPALYLALSLLQSQPGRYQGLWLMLVITAGLGVYGAAFARTLDRDLAALTQYQLGSDLWVHPLWESEVLSVDADGQPDEMAYREPPFSQLQDLPGVTGTARVQTRRDVSLAVGSRSLGKADLIGIQPQEFGLTARFWPELTPAPPARYLQALAGEEQAVLVSTALAGRLGLKPGDRLQARKQGGQAALTVAGIVPYWPGRLPEAGEFVVGNLTYLQDSLGLEPYDVWLRLAPDASVPALVQTLQERGVRLTALADRRAALAAGRRQPLRLGIYATLSAGFVVALLVMALTYLLGVGLTLQARARELGVLQAMGLSAAGVAGSLYAEQLLLVGTAAVAGLAGGGWAAALYVPYLRRQPGQYLLPLPVADAAGEQVWLLLGFALALVLGAATVWLWLRRLAIGQALRLGEDG